MRTVESIFDNRWFHLISIAVIGAAVIAVYSNTLHSTFHFDDYHAIVDNPKIRSLDNTWAILFDELRGVSVFTYALNYAVGGYNVEGYHIVNIAIHLASSLLAYFILFLTLSRLSSSVAWSRKIAFFIALLFAVHPVQTQSVTYLVQRMESLSSLFYLAAVLFFILASCTAAVAKRWVFYGAVLLCYLLAFYSKEITITLPAMLLIYDFYFLRGTEAGGIFKRWPLYAALAVLFVYFTVNTVAPLGGFGDLDFDSIGFNRLEQQSKVLPSDGAPPPGDNVDDLSSADRASWKSAFSFSLVSSAYAAESPAAKEERKLLQRKDLKSMPTAGFGLKGITPKEYLYTQFNVLTYYILLLAVPLNQNLDYDFPLSKNLFSKPLVSDDTIFNTPLPPPVVSLAALIIIFAAAFYMLYRSRHRGGVRSLVASYFIFWFFIILSPTSSFVPIVDIIFEHRVYLASLGFFATLVLFIDWGVGRIFSGRQSGRGETA